MPADGLSLELTRLFLAPRARVFEFFTAAALLAEWWGPRGFSIPSIDFIPRVGGTYRIEMQPANGDAFVLAGTFREVDIPSRLAFTFEWEPPEPDDQETVAQLAFEVTDADSTRVQLRQGPFKAEARRALHRDGWTESFDKLAELVTQQP
jgi:uncharacterized protein YndB with AHSA1/START domain